MAMSSKAAIDSGLGQIGVDTARHYADLILNDFPQPGKQFRRDDLECHSAKRHLQVLYERDVINLAEEKKDWLEYEVDQRAHAVAKAARENRESILPCEHAGMIHLRDGRGFVCSYWKCGKIHEREEILEWRDER